MRKKLSVLLLILVLIMNHKQSNFHPFPNSTNGICPYVNIFDTMTVQDHPSLFGILHYIFEFQVLLYLSFAG